MILTYFGLDLRQPYRCVNINSGYFEEFSSLQALTPNSDEVIIALSDKFIFQQNASQKALQSSLELLSSCHLTVKAIDTESQAIARALRYFEGLSSNDCFVIFSICLSDLNEHQLWLSAFKDKNKLFFHEEKIPVNSDSMIQNYVLFLQRSLKLLKIKYPELKIKKYYLLTSDTDLTSWLTASGLSLWEEKKDDNYLPESAMATQALFTLREKKLMMKQLMKAIIYGFVTVLMFHLILISFMTIQHHKTTVLQKKLLLIQSESQSLFTQKNQLHLLQQQTDSLTALQHNQHLPINLLESLSHVMPEGVFLNSLNAENNKITLTGRAQLEEQINILHKQLMTQQYFQHAVIKNTAQDESTLPYHYSFIIESEMGEKQ
jgi:Tfp pilus assembly protein PilN